MPKAPSWSMQLCITARSLSEPITIATGACPELADGAFFSDTMLFSLVKELQ
jgi:hypothetical protein